MESSYYNIDILTKKKPNMSYLPVAATADKSTTTTMAMESTRMRFSPCLFASWTFESRSSPPICRQTREKNDLQIQLAACLFQCCDFDFSSVPFPFSP